MSTCNRCGEPNHADARYCGTCGTVLPTDEGIESLVADDGGPDEVATPRHEPGADDTRTSEYVSPPSYGETGPVTEPPPTPPTPPTPSTPSTPPIVTGPTTVVVPPSGTPSGPERPHVAAGAATVSSGTAVRASTSTGIMIAALAIAAVVIIGGVFVLLSRGSGGTDVARTGDSVAPTEPSTEPLPSATPVPAETVESAPATVLPETVPPESVAQPTAEPQTSASAPSPTAPPPPAPTAPPNPASTVPPPPAPTSPPPTPTRGPGDLGLTQPILNESCDGRYITFVGSAIGDRPYTSVVAELLEIYPGTNYIWTKACPSLRQEFVNGADIYGVVFGPYGTQQEACNARAFGPDDAYVRRISTTDPQDHTIRC